MIGKSLSDRLRSSNANQNIKSIGATKNLYSGFRILGINPPERYKTVYIIYSAVLNLLACIFLPFNFTLSLSISDMEVENFLTSLQIGINLYGCAIKFIIMSFLLKKLCKCESILNALDARCIEKDEKDEIRKITIKGNRIVIFFGFINFSYTTCAFLSSILQGAPPYSLYIPFVNWRASTIEFIISAATEYTLVDIACIQNAVNDSYALIYIGILRMQVQVLLKRIAKLGADPKRTKEQNTEELIKCIIDHSNIIEVYNIIHPVISTTLFVQFMITAAVISTTLINILISDSVSSSISSLLYIFAVVIETLPCCYYANCLMDESDWIATTIFHSNWIEQEFKFRKLLVFFIQRSQKTITLTAGKLFPITLKSFLGIAKFSFSLYTLLGEIGYGRK